jgi:DNA-binding protein YbaB
MVIHQQQAEELFAVYRQRQAEAAELRRKLAASTATAVAPRGVVKVTVAANGDVTSIDFPTSAYKRMAPAELARVLVSTIGDARAKALTAAAEVLTPELPKGLNFAEMAQGKAYLSAAAPSEEDIPDAVRKYLNGRAPRS